MGNPCESHGRRKGHMGALQTHGRPMVPLVSPISPWISHGRPWEHSYPIQVQWKSNGSPVGDPWESAMGHHHIPIRTPWESHGNTSNSWKLHGSPMADPREFRGPAQQTHRRPTGVPRETHESPIGQGYEVIEAPWELHGNPMEVPHGSLLITLLKVHWSTTHYWESHYMSPWEAHGTHQKVYMYVLAHGSPLGLPKIL